MFATSVVKNSHVKLPASGRPAGPTRPTTQLFMRCHPIANHAHSLRQRHSSAEDTFMQGQTATPRLDFFYWLTCADESERRCSVAWTSAAAATSSSRIPTARSSCEEPAGGASSLCGDEAWAQAASWDPASFFEALFFETANTKVETFFATAPHGRVSTV